MTPLKDHWERIISTGRDVCFVCDHKFKKAQSKVYIGVHKVNEEPLYRHEYCDAVSNNWHKKFVAVKPIKRRVKIVVTEPVPLKPQRRKIQVIKKRRKI